MRNLGSLLLHLGVLSSAVLALAPAASAQSAPPGAPLGPHDSSLFSPADFVDAPVLIQELDAQSDLISAFLWGRFSPAVQQTLADATAQLPARVAALVEGLDSVLRGESILGEPCFEGVPLSPQTRMLAAQVPQGGDRIRLNRLLLEDAYRGELRKSPPARPVPQTGTGVSTDQSDYAPGTTAHIRGRGFQAGETVVLQVLHADGTPDEGEDHAPWSVIAGASGGFQATWHVCEDDCLGSTLMLSAVGQSSGRLAQARFTDALGAPTFETLKSIGTPPSGGYPVCDLIQGTDGALYGTAQSGGSFGAGTVFKLNPDGSGFAVLKSFDYSTDGGYPYAGLVQGTDGALYGTASQGGSSGYGTVFRLSADGSGFAVLRSFDYSTGGYLLGGELVLGTDGALYGTTHQGGASGYGTVFRLNTDGSGFAVLEDFDYVTTGGYPNLGGLIQGTDGALYGTVTQGGSSGYGTLFRLNTDGSGFTVLRDFDYVSTGGYLYGGLMQGSDGALYGTASQGGSTGYGTAFKVNTDGSGFAILQSFDYSTTGAYLYAGLVQAADGSLYGKTYYGGSSGYGTVFQLDTDGTGFAILKSFDHSTSGGYLYGGELVQGTDGALYGTATQGGSHGAGTVFKLNTDGSGFTVLKNLSQSTDFSESGAYLYSGVVQGTDGALYGTAYTAGIAGSGTVFRLNADGTGFTVLESFNHSTTGGYPFAAELIQGTDGVLYGTCSQGGIGGYGTVFKLNTDGSGFTVLRDFDYYTTGGYLYSGLMQGTDGALYGTAEAGGLFGGGTLFKLNTDGSGFAILLNCDYSSTGAYPYGGELIQGSDGALYGACSSGGSSGYGTVFKLNTDGSGFTVLEDFDYSTTGGYIYSGLTLGSGGALYGLTHQGGSSSYGTVFKLNTDGSGFAVLQDLDYSTTGGYPQGNGLVQGPDGALYSTVYQGGALGAGTLIKVNTDGTDFVVVQHFDNAATGGYPLCALMKGTDGNLYGTTSQGGTSGVGTVFRLVFDTPPVADAGDDFSVNEGQLVTLDGSGSGPDPDALTYAWEQLPGGTAVTLTGAGTDSPTFTAPYVALGGETLSFELTVTAGTQSSTDTVSVTVVNVNHPPVADAGLDQAIAEGSPVTLHGEDSFDIDNDLFGYAWTQVSGSPVVGLAGAGTANPSFTAPDLGTGGAPGVVATLVFELQVDDGYPPDQAAPGYTLASVVDSVTIEITNVNNEPIAVAGDDQTVDEHTAVVLDGTDSSDPDSDTLTYDWTQVSGPLVLLSGDETAMPSFTAPFVGAGGADLTFELTVDDGFSGSATGTVTVHVQNANDPPLASAARPTTAALWPPNHGLVLVGIAGVSDPDNDATITITHVTQDEPTNGLGDGDTAIDALIGADGTVLLRAERSGNGNGRVYHVHFTASDLEGSVSGVVTVVVPHQKKSLAIDGGELYDSTN